MKETMAHRRARPTVRMLLLSAGISVITSAVALGQDSPEQPDEVAGPHVHSDPEHTSRAPCVPTAADRNPDVFKRPCFARALVDSRQAPWVSGWRTAETGVIKLAQEQLPPQEIEELQSLLASVLRADYLPAAWDEVEFYGLTPCRGRNITEMRNGVKTFVRHEFDCNVDVTELSDRDAILSGWTVNDIDVLPMSEAFRARPMRGVSIRLRLHGDQRLTLRPRPENFGAPEGRRAFFDRAALHDLLTRVFRVPFEASDDWFTDGYDAEYEGVRVFHGYIVAAERARVWPGGDNPPQHWWEQMRLLVTDSDPQYFCVLVILRDADVAD